MQTIAKRKLKKTAMPVMAAYFAIFIGTMFAVDKVHPKGWMLCVAAALPTIPFLTVFVLVGQYLVSEKDEYSRDLMVRCMLWGTAASLSIAMFVGFLQIFGWTGKLPAFTEFYAFAFFMLAAKFSNRVSNPLPSDE